MLCETEHSPEGLFRHLVTFCTVERDRADKLDKGRPSSNKYFPRSISLTVEIIEPSMISHRILSDLP